jgi:hypothetical protein
LRGCAHSDAIFAEPNNTNATWFPLHRAVREPDVVIDLWRDNQQGVYQGGDDPGRSTSNSTAPKDR